MWLAIVAVIVGLAILVWSADVFIDGAVVLANKLNVPSFLIGVVILGLGTSAPEMVVSAIASLQGNPGLALGNAYGSNITNIGLVVGLVAVLAPIRVQSQIIKKELPLLLGITFLAGFQLIDGELSRVDAFVLIAVFFGVMAWSIIQDRKKSNDTLEAEYKSEIDSHPMSLTRALGWLFIGLVLLVVSSRMLVWGAVVIAQSFGVSDLIIGLTIVAIGTSLPELASSLAAIRKNEHELALGNVLGSGLFNTLAVVGIAAGIHPLSVAPEVLYRDWVLMTVLTAALLIMCVGWKGRRGEIGRIKGSLLLLAYAGYNLYLLALVLSQ